jgi:cytochrome P450
MNVIFRAMTRDEEVYQDADSFRPERFLKDDGALNDDTMDYAFGFGRRYVAFTLDSYKIPT